MWQPNQKKNRTQISWLRASPGGNSGNFLIKMVYYTEVAIHQLPSQRKMCGLVAFSHRRQTRLLAFDRLSGTRRDYPLWWFRLNKARRCKNIYVYVHIMGSLIATHYILPVERSTKQLSYIFIIIVLTSTVRSLILHDHCIGGFSLDKYDCIDSNFLPIFGPFAIRWRYSRLHRAQKCSEIYLADVLPDG